MSNEIQYLSTLVDHLASSYLNLEQQIVDTRMMPAKELDRVIETYNKEKWGKDIQYTGAEALAKG